MLEEQQGRAIGSVRVWEIIVAALFFIFAAVVVWDSRRLGAQWGSDGPQAGYFPFYIGVFILVSAAVNLLSAILMGAPGRAPFVYWGQLKMILIVMVPSFVYVALIANPWFGLGIYVASAIFIAAFMVYLGKYGALMAAAVSIGTMLSFFLMFEIWFKVPLPKGPLETWLGFN